MSEYFNQFFSNEDENYSLIIEDNGKVAYAYLLYHEDVIGDVWLYNQSPAAIKNEWDDGNDMPFLNSLEYIDQHKVLKPIEDSIEIELKWNFNSVEKPFVSVEILIRGRIISKISSGSKPGWSSLVIKDGPLAKVL